MSSHPAPFFDPDLIARYDVNGPRYTSYPTAPEFDARFGEAEYREDGFVCGPNQSCKPPHRFSTYCHRVYAPPNGFSAVKFSDELDGSLFRPCPTGT